MGTTSTESAHRPLSNFKSLETGVSLATVKEGQKKTKRTQLPLYALNGLFSRSWFKKLQPLS